MPRTRGRPRSFDPQSALRQISEAFRERGFSATSLDDVARITGLNRPSLYSAFGDKKAMYLAALAALNAELRTAPARLAAAGLDLEGSLKALYAASIKAYLAGPNGPGGCLAVGTASAEATADPDIRAALAETLEVVDGVVASLFERAGAPQPRRKARLVAATLHSLSIRARAGAPRRELDDIAADALALVLGRKT